jgi:cobalamin 5'-phosphate synthase/cobalamin synthase
MAAALPWFPVVGLLIGATLAVVDWTLRPVLSLGERSVIVLVVSAGMTGLLHLDGFIDCCDALLGTRSIERRLDILRDSRVGAYGVIGGALLLLLSYAALVALNQPAMRIFALLSAPLLGRLSMVYAVVRYPYARTTGVGAPFRASRRHFAYALICGATLLVAISIVSGLPPVLVALSQAALAAGAALAVTLGVTAWISGHLGGGLTGDTYGAINECVQVAILALVPPIFAATAHLH